MKAQATAPFFDIKEQKYRKTGEIFEIDSKRFDKLAYMRLVEKADEPSKNKIKQ